MKNLKFCSRKLDNTLKLEISIEFDSPRVVNVFDANSSASPSSSPTTSRRKSEGLSLSVLPPVVLQISLPPSYPLYTPPDILSVQVSLKWFSNVEDIKDALFKLYSSGETVLYNWIEYLRNGGFLADLHALSPDDGLSVESNNHALCSSSMSESGIPTERRRSGHWVGTIQAVWRMFIQFLRPVQKYMEYLAAEEDSVERRTIELRYGRSFVLRLVAQHEQDQATEQWISSSTTLCPGCESPVQKSEGCNHMQQAFLLSLRRSPGLKVTIQSLFERRESMLQETL
ncbi:E3 ubiquitin-protein ligase itt1 [Psilocybe cubensis]|uniref:RWD domain-containing protein n=2 Tax=Psilocybe cubensis TaxID=181762 RepID=A0A8H7Y679_PSICU|nr:E3 ubiquitin-protein ligase itt1 [Psilocybe cubensis]KAH9487159.1 E3 ubiquitin-protein ligase itt1 [Psilocybe cubensis]